MRVYLSLLILIPGFAFAERYETETLFRKGAWLVEITADTADSSLWCTAKTDNRARQSFSITAYDNRQLVLFIFDDNWKLRERSVRFIVDVDYSRWTVDGSASGIGVSSYMSDVDKAVRFLRQIKKGNAVAVYNDNLQRLATFSLSGSSAAIDALFDCWSKIDRSDPFGDGSDPFGASTDPFN